MPGLFNPISLLLAGVSSAMAALAWGVGTIKRVMGLAGPGDFFKSPAAPMLCILLAFLAGYALAAGHSQTVYQTRAAVQANHALAKADETERAQTRKLREYDKRNEDIVNEIKKLCPNTQCSLTPALVDRLQQLR